MIPEMAMEPKRKVVMPPITQVGVLAKKAPICKPNESCLGKLAVDTSSTNGVEQAKFCTLDIEYEQNETAIPTDEGDTLLMQAHSSIASNTVVVCIKSVAKQKKFSSVCLELCVTTGRVCISRELGHMAVTFPRTPKRKSHRAVATPAMRDAHSVKAMIPLF